MKFLALKNWLWEGPNGKFVSLRGRSSVVESDEDLSLLERGTLFRKLNDTEVDLNEKPYIGKKKVEFRPKPVVRIPTKKK